MSNVKRKLAIYAMGFLTGTTLLSSSYGIGVSIVKQVFKTRTPQDKVALARVNEEVPFILGVYNTDNRSTEGRDDSTVHHLNVRELLNPASNKDVELTKKELETLNDRDGILSVALDVGKVLGIVGFFAGGLGAALVNKRRRWRKVPKGYYKRIYEIRDKARKVNDELEEQLPDWFNRSANGIYLVADAASKNKDNTIKICKMGERSDEHYVAKVGDCNEPYGGLSYCFDGKKEYVLVGANHHCLFIDGDNMYWNRVICRNEGSQGIEYDVGKPTIEFTKFLDSVEAKILECTNEVKGLDMENSKSYKIDAKGQTNSTFRQQLKDAQQQQMKK